MSLKETINRYAADLYTRNVEKGWWSGEQANIPSKLCLIHSEVSEALEGYRKNLMDDHLPNRQMIEVELADAVIRICELAGYLGLDLGGAIEEKDAYNSVRKDHTKEARSSANGKRF